MQLSNQPAPVVCISCWGSLVEPAHHGLMSLMQQPGFDSSSGTLLQVKKKGAVSWHFYLAKMSLSFLWNCNTLIPVRTIDGIKTKTCQREWSGFVLHLCIERSEQVCLQTQLDDMNVLVCSKHECNHTCKNVTNASSQVHKSTCMHDAMLQWLWILCALLPETTDSTKALCWKTKFLFLRCWSDSPLSFRLSLFFVSSFSLSLSLPGQQNQHIK